MQWCRRAARIGIAALLLNAGLILVPGGDRFGLASPLSGVVSADPVRSDAPPTAGDPDGPTGEVGPPTSGSINEPADPIKSPVRRMSTLTRIQTAFSLWLRFTFVR
jgi:hypothetical protein